MRRSFLAEIRPVPVKLRRVSRASASSELAEDLRITPNIAETQSPHYARSSNMRTLIQHARGRTTRQAHRDLDGLLEDELTRDGFDGRSALLYRANDPTKFRATGRFKTTLIQSAELAPGDLKDPEGTAQRLFYNADCTVWLSRRATTMPFYRRNVDGDECWFVHRGTGTVETEFGPLSFEPGDYVVIPKSITHRWVMTSDEAILFGCETVGELSAPTYVGLGRYAPFDSDVVRVPEPGPALLQAAEYVVRVKYDGEYSTLLFTDHPCEVLGWKGDLFPFAFNIRDWNVIMSDTLHLPPTMHCFLTAPGVNLINLLPRPFESVRGVERLPWYHRNADYDEVVLIHGGHALGRPLPLGVIGHEPQGLHHGFGEKLRQRCEDEWAQHHRLAWEIIMIETRRPLKVDAAVTPPAA
jgi:homogentisate 1,2-dioxygenase